ncbi:hypothetical protein BTO01_05245 [Vibrio jasicida]|uniref:hypothetical protein n=1 Tax=Vibrio jasicida TaxID=766224 RepID=UPI000CF45382|nr:hypothetical protein [Vibrio jasicida]PQJ71688.1 hypothetical protein BTO01_05245 [Vibrio jasicida]
MNWSNNQKNEHEIHSRIGWISEIHPDGHRLKIDYEGNPLTQPIWGSIGRAFTRGQINAAIDNQLDCRIEFFTGDPNLPILTDIYFSLINHDTLILKANQVVLEATQEVVIRSGEAATRHKASDGSIQTSATYISSSADKLHKLQGKKINLN